MTSQTPDRRTQPFRVAFVPGVTPDKWARIWAERMPRVPLELLPITEEEQTAVLDDGRAEMCLVRLPVDPDGLHVIPLYDEVPVVVAPKDHFVEAADEVSVADLADEHLLQDPDLVPEWRDVATEVAGGSRPPLPDLTIRQAIETVAAGVGIVIVPMSVARLHHRKDVVHRPVTDVAPSTVGLAWRRDVDDDRIEAFVGVVRGRTANSSRGATPKQEPQRASGQPNRQPSRQPPQRVKRPSTGGKGRPSPRRGRRR